MSALDWSRAAFIAALLAFVAVAKPARIARRVKDFFSEPGSATTLGVLRIVTFGYLASATEPFRATQFTSLPKWMLDWPPGWEVLKPVVPLDAEVVVWLEGSLLVASLLACVGLWGRTSMLCAGLLAPLVLGIPNLYGKVNHGNHVIVLWSMILAFSPAADALSLDWLLRRMRGARTPGPSPSYALPLRFAWLVLASSYFFAGFWKLWDAGDLYFDGRRVKSEMLEKWASQEQFVPLVRIDDSDFLLSLLGAWTVIVEMGVLFAIFVPLGRVLIAPQLVALHVGIKYTLGITFKAGIPLVLLFDMRTLERWVPGLEKLSARVQPWMTQRLDAARDRLALPERWPAPRLKRRSTLPAWLIGGALSLGMLGTGALEINTQPVSVFPRFSSRTTKLAKRGRSDQMILVRAGTKIEEDITESARMPRGLKKRWIKRLSSLKKKRRKKALRRELQRFAQRFEPKSGPIERGDRLVVYRRKWPVDPDAREGRVKRKVKARFRFE